MSVLASPGQQQTLVTEPTHHPTACREAGRSPWKYVKPTAGTQPNSPGYAASCSTPLVRCNGWLGGFVVWRRCRRYRWFVEFGRSVQ